MGLAGKAIRILRDDGLIPLIRRTVHYVADYPNRRRDEKKIRQFRRDFFESQAALDAYIVEFEKRELLDVLERAKETYADQRTTEQTAMAELAVQTARRLYALIRVEEPELIVETGVANGFSSTVILAALDENGHGELISVDVPFTEEGEDEIAPVPEGQHGDILEQFEDGNARRETDYSIVIPYEQEPGWMVPREFRDRWDLRLGRSQRKLPELFYERDEVDVFMHDSDHRFPCQLFEYEIGWEHLADGGILLSDDIHQPWQEFTAVREYSASGLLDRNFGYMIK